MQYEIFTIPMVENAEHLEKMNRFLRGHKVVQVDKEIVSVGDRQCWSFCVSYLNEPGGPAQAAFGEKKDKIDYKAVLSEEHFAVFSRLRAIRKQLAEGDAVPAYAVFTDAELAAISQMESMSAASLLKLENVGKKRVEKYGLALLDCFAQESAQPGEGQQ